jgi:hypothetical protein
MSLQSNAVPEPVFIHAVHVTHCRACGVVCGPSRGERWCPVLHRVLQRSDRRPLSIKHALVEREIKI